MVVDAHQHFWDPARAHYAWLTDARAAIRRRFGPEDLAPVLAANGIDRSIVVEARSSLEETRELLEIAAAADLVAGVVGWVDVRDPELAATVAALRARPGGRYLVGIRHQVREEADPRWLARNDVLRGLAALADAGLACDLLVRPRELPAAREAAVQVPALTFVVEHLGAPSLGDGDDPEWASGMARLAEQANVHCKISGLSIAPADRLAPFLRRLRTWFGEDRLLFGSDWPVCLLGAAYEEVLARFDELTQDASDAARRAMLGDNAVRVYGLPAG